MAVCLASQSVSGTPGDALLPTNAGSHAAPHGQPRRAAAEPAAGSVQPTPSRRCSRHGVRGLLVAAIPTTMGIVRRSLADVNIGLTKFVGHYHNDIRSTGQLKQCVAERCIRHCSLGISIAGSRDMARPAIARSKRRLPLGDRHRRARAAACMPLPGDSQLHCFKRTPGQY